MKKSILIALASVVAIVGSNWLPYLYFEEKLAQQIGTAQQQINSLSQSTERMQEAMKLLKQSSSK